jgi:enterochelin esterase-like enzyme/mannose-6-phosphate isomerase-like protein (cupin superfamily)
VPAQYQPGDPAALMIFQDGHTYIREDANFRVATVFDNLISQQKMPVTIGLFINPGHDQNAPPPENPWRVTNRSIEYDEMSDTYARFLLEEMIPEITKEYTISEDPKMRAICGISSGGICAFTVAWHFPDQFQKVMSHIGSFTNIRGGHNYEALIRKTDKKDIKVFLQDGSGDLDNEHGNWWLANLQMEAALKFKNYDYKFVAGTEGHNDRHGAAILPQSLEWLWSDMVPNLVASSVYFLPKEGESSTIISGETTHFSEMYFSLQEIRAGEEVKLTNLEKEQIVIIKDGSLEATFANQSKILGPKSVAILYAGDEGSIRAHSTTASYYTMVYKAKNPTADKLSTDNESSFMQDFEEVPFKSHDRGGVRSYFNRSTAMCPYYEMHVTTLNESIKSHEPHTHAAAEIILMIEGETEMEIGNKKYHAKAGDLYFAGSNIPHAIRNTGKGQCMYFAFQWY